MKKTDGVNLREYSTSKFHPSVRNHLKRYPFSVREGDRVVFEIEVLGLDKGEAIGRLRSWIGGNSAWRFTDVGMVEGT